MGLLMRQLVESDDPKVAKGSVRNRGPFTPEVFHYTRITYAPGEP